MPKMQDRAVVGIPAGMQFSDLCLARSDEGDVSFSTDTVEKIAIANGLPADFFMQQPEDVVGELITRWYVNHRAAGGVADPVAEDLISEVAAESLAGQGYSYQPGKA